MDDPPRYPLNIAHALGRTDHAWTIFCAQS
jgi:hypothetical protein